MSDEKRMVWVGPVRLGAFKACAKLLGRALGVAHSRSLDALAKACGWLSYAELICHPQLEHGGCVCAKGSFDEIYDLWCGQVVASYELESRAQLDVIERLQKAFRTSLRNAPVECDSEAGEHPCDVTVPRNIHDPMLQARDWRDAEFRQWIGHIVDLGKPKVRDGDDSSDAAERESINRLAEEFV